MTIPYLCTPVELYADTSTYRDEIKMFKGEFPHIQVKFISYLTSAKHFI